MTNIRRIGLTMLVILVAVIAGRVAATSLPFLKRSATRAEKAVYYCPMHPSYTSDRPGDCPICNMRLVLKESTAPDRQTMGPEAHAAHAPAGYTPVSMDLSRQQLIGVRTAPVVRKSLIRTIRTAGRVAYDPALYQAQQEYLQAFQSVGAAGELPGAREQAQRLLEAARTRLQLMGLSPAFLEEMRDWTGPDQALLLGDPAGRVWVYATIYEFEIPWVKPGQAVVAESAAFPGRRFEGVVKTLDPVVDRATRAVTARVLVKDLERVLQPQMFLDTTILVDFGERLTVPQEAVFSTGLRHLLFVVRDGTVFEPRDVTIGVSADDGVEILEGVAEGEAVVIHGNFLIDSESRLKAALEGMGGGHQHGQ